MMEKMFSLAYLTVPGTHPADQIEIAARCGYEGVSLRPISMKLPGEPDFRLANPVIYQNVKSALNRTGVKLLDIELARVGDGIDVSAYEADFEKAAELGARYVISSVWSPEREYSLAQLETICDMAQKYNLLVNLEFMAFANVRTLEESLEVMDQVNRPNLRLMVDTLHAHRAGVTQEMLKKVPAEKFGFVHLCDGPAWIPPDDHPDMAGVARSARLYVGEGGIDIAGMLHGIAEIPYYSIELPNAAEIEAGGKLAHAARCLDTAKRYLTANGLL